MPTNVAPTKKQREMEAALETAGKNNELLNVVVNDSFSTNKSGKKKGKKGKKGASKKSSKQVAD